MSLATARALLFTAGFLLWAITSVSPLMDAVQEGWDAPAYWQIGVPFLLASQVTIAFLSDERPALAPLWPFMGHIVAMLLVHPPGADLSLFPLALFFVGLPSYVVLFLAALVGRKLRSLRGIPL